MDKIIYLDHAAATPLNPKAQKAMEPYFATDFFNPSSPYLPALEVRRAYESAKAKIARACGGKSADLTITASATESIAIAFNSFKNILVSAIEHPAVIAAAQTTAPKISSDKTGKINLDDLSQKITPDTQLVSVALVNHELGTIQPIAEIAALIKKERLKRLKSNNQTAIFLHCDASQALTLLDVHVARLGVDLLTISSAKIYGPKGVAALWHAPRVPITPIILGGGQESGLRSGTENVPALIGFAKAIEEAQKHLTAERKRLLSLRTSLRTILATNPNIKFLGQGNQQLVSFLPISIPGLDAERLIYKLEKIGVLVSTGAACAASKGLPSHVLKAIGLSQPEIAGSLRVTLGKLNTPQNIKIAGSLILKVISEETERLRLCSPKSF
jgi:cysteine desulfurase